jgi:hypothetical protein
MSKRKERRQKAELFEQVRGAAHSPTGADDSLIFPGMVSDSAPSKERHLMKKFRFQLLHEWISENLSPGRLADVAGGKGLLAFLLQQDGWETVVIDPVFQDLPSKYKDLISNTQVQVSPEAKVSRLDVPFKQEMAKDFDVLVAMHAHGCNIQLIDAAAEFGREAILLPCCVIGEPILPPPGTHWIQALVEYAVGKSFVVMPFRLNFKGQNIGLYLRQSA